MARSLSTPIRSVLLVLGWWAVTPRLWELASEPEWRYVNALRVGYWIQWMLNLIKGGHTIILHPLTRQKEAEYQQWIPYPRHFFWGVTRTSGCSRLGGAFIWISMLERTVKNVGIIISENRNTMRYNCASNLNFILGKSCILVHRNCQRWNILIEIFKLM